MPIFEPQKIVPILWTIINIFLILLPRRTMGQQPHPCDDPWYACDGPDWHLGGPYDDGYGYAQHYCYKILNYDPNLDGPHFYWEDAEKACNLYSSNLVSIHSETENIFVGRMSLPYYRRQNPDHATYKGFWIGMRRFPSNQQNPGQPYPYDAPFTQIWSDGTPVTYGLQPVNSHGYSLSPWWSSQPDYGGPNSFETCVVTYMFPSYFGAPYLLTTPAFYNKWNDIGCGDQIMASGQRMVINMAGAICKKAIGLWCMPHPAPPPESPSAPPTLPEAGAQPEAGGVGGLFWNGMMGMIGMMENNGKTKMK